MQFISVIFQILHVIRTLQIFARKSHCNSTVQNTNINLVFN